ncbi:alpha/beta hydrolase, partial [Marinobacter sp. VGCF2001]
MLWILLAVVTLIVLVTLLIFRVKDLSGYDGRDWIIKEVVPNPAHDEVIERIKDMGRASRGLKGKARLMALRNHLDGLGENVEIESDIRHQDHPRGEWVLAPGANPRRRVLYIHGGAW